MNTRLRHRFDDEFTKQAWETYKGMGKWNTQPMLYGEAHYMLQLRQIPTLSAINFLKMLGHEGVDSYEQLFLTKSEYDSYMNFLSMLDGV